MAVGAEDAEAMRRCQQGDLGGLAALVERYQVSAARVAFLLVHDRALAEDIVQESFLLAYRARGRFRLDAPFAPWFYQIVVNATRQQLRTSARRREVSLDRTALPAGDGDRGGPLGVLVAPDPAEHAELREERDALLSALGQVPLKQRAALVLHFYAGYSDKELAMAIGCPAGTARWRLHAGLKALERIIRSQSPWLLADMHNTSHPEGTTRERARR